MPKKYVTIKKNVYLVDSEILKLFNNKSKLNKESTLTKIANDISPFTPKLLRVEKNYMYLSRLQCDTLSKIEFTENESIALLKKILVLTSSFHSFGFYHRDLKPDNIMYDHNNVFFIDFGASFVDKTIYKKENRNIIIFNPRLNCFSILYCPPEGFLFHKSIIDKVNWEKYEVYSIGVTICSILKKINFNKMKLLDEFISGNVGIEMVKEIKSDFINFNFENEKLCELLKLMTNYEPDKRPTIKECIDFCNENFNS